MSRAPADRYDVSSTRCQTPAMAWLTNTTVVFPVAMLCVAALAVATEPLQWATTGWLLGALAPWALIAAGLRVPPMLVVVTTTAAAAMLVLRYDGAGAMFLPIVMLAWTAAQGLKLASAVAFVSNTVIVLRAFTTDHDAFQRSGAVSWITGLGMGWFLGVLVDRQRRLSDDLTAARHELGLAAVREERAMVAREVHDIVGHSLTVVLLNISGARRQLAKNADSAAEALDRAEAVTRDSLETVRNVVGLLSSENQRFEPMPGGGDVRTLIEQARQSGLPVSLTLNGDPAELEPAVGLTLVRLLQESLSNANRHAPSAPIEVTVAVERAFITATVANPLPRVNDAPPASTRRGLGIASMTDRVQAARGRLDIGRRGDRWIVHCELPRPVHGRPEPGVSAPAEAAQA